MLEVDYDLLKEKKVNLVSPVIVLNSDYFEIKNHTGNYSVKHGEELFTCTEI